jgi:hypothetical protein
LRLNLLFLCSVLTFLVVTLAAIALAQHTPKKPVSCWAEHGGDRR